MLLLKSDRSNKRCQLCGRADTTPTRSLHFATETGGVDLREVIILVAAASLVLALSGW